MVEIVADISGNHGGILNKAITLIEEAAFAGCDYVKFQYYKPEDMPDVDVGNNREMYEKLAVRKSWLRHLFANRNIGVFASVFSAEGAKEILEYGVPYIKIASPDSTKLADETYNEIDALVPPDVEIIWSGRGRLATARKVLYCPLGHPPTITWNDFSDFRVGNYYGFSDHTPGIRAPLAFVRAGAEMVEKHIKLAGDNDCIDAAFSAEPETMRLLCKLAYNHG